ncbi:phytoene/squalene synthase family protein [Phytohalomonas tamaricis]|uniref:phytoene/squalene synthase family protein n=1 Tax=Phytohalomonas tamaricis TaxID=2081032 RepID=UPI000D0B611B|nr:phytoene/squalene synthase family protein [Phytohalomonas tamaricis]
MQQAQQTLAKHGKSFWFASRFMDKRDARDAAQLYMVCRELDDLADQEMPDPAMNAQARQRLSTIRQQLIAGHGSDVTANYLIDLAERRGLDLQAAVALIDALISDVDRPACIESDAELLDYCYGVAGTVGVMMCPVLGAPPRAVPHAIDLGIAMQMTNIARDVLEDATQGRRYIPGSWLGGRSAARLARCHAENCDNAEDRDTTARAVERLLDHAERYYRSAADGFAYIPPKNRTAIRIAAEVYRGIGQRLRQRNHAWWQGRVYVPLSGKLWLATRTLSGRGDIQASGRDDHEGALHHHIAGRPGTNA